jgi:hypothetical protein
MANGKLKMENGNISKSLSGCLTLFSIIDPLPRHPDHQADRQVWGLGSSDFQAVVRSARDRDQAPAL